MDNTADKYDKSSSGIAIDGQRTRSIREEKKLTQLYVANVVGVTTDTISRWENNRYPSIKRDNAEKLAAALEVPLEAIVRQEPEVQPEPPPATPPHRRRTFLVLFLVLLIVIAGVILLQIPAPITATRWLPPFTPPGAVVPVQIRVARPESSQEGFIIREQLPGGWRLISASPAPAPAQGAGGELKWLVAGSRGPATISYTVQSDPAAPLNSTALFTGTVIAHAGGMTRSREIGDRQKITIAPLHWADRNGDQRIDDNEIMPAYDLSEEMKGLGIDWKEIEAIWSGKGYRWDGQARRFVVLH